MFGDGSSGLIGPDATATSCFQSRNPYCVYKAERINDDFSLRGSQRREGTEETISPDHSSRIGLKVLVMRSASSAGYSSLNVGVTHYQGGRGEERKKE